MNIFRKNNILIDGLLSDTYLFLQSTYNQTRSLFTVASAWGQILFVLQNLSQLILYFIEDSITELNIDQATRDYSVRSLARISGYDPGRARSAQGEISIKWNLQQSDVGGSAVIIKNFAQIQCLQNGKTYSIIANAPSITFNLVPGTSTVLKIAQGVFQEAVFTGNGGALQSFNIPSRFGAYVDQFYVEVYVNEEKWMKYESLYDIPFNGKGYLIKGGIAEGLDVFFGNSYFGMVPPAGSRVRIQFLKSLGQQGNIASTKEKPLTYRFSSLGTDLFGSEVNLNNYLDISNRVDPSFGSDPESTDLIRLVAPHTSRSFVFANAENYEIFLQKLGIFSQIQAYSTFDDEYLDDDNIVYIFLVPDINLNITSNTDYFDIPTQSFLLTRNQKLAILNLIQQSGSMVATTVVKITEPTINRIVGNAVLSIFEGYDPDTIKAQIRQNVSDYMLNLKRRDKIPRSDFISIIESIEGVDSVNFFFVVQKNESNAIVIQNLPFPANQQPIKQLGLDSFGDVIIGRNELVLMRGGWTDRNGTYYQDGIVAGKPSALNINITSVVSQSFLAMLNAEQKANIMVNNSAKNFIN